jgi:murein DD-endopeptidase
LRESLRVSPGRPKLGLATALGLFPLRERAAEAWIALRGAPDVPPSRFDLSSLHQLRPRLALALWRGRAPFPRQVLITNLFNHTPTPESEGWSVRKRQMRDFRGRTLTYDSHNGTDFAVPVGSDVATCTSGEVTRVVCEYNRGGWKVFIDHGGGWVTCYAHLAIPLVAPGDRVVRGQVIARSGYSGLDGLVTFPLGVPHIHLNTWLHGVPVDPFPHSGQVSMWRGGSLPAPAEPDSTEAPFRRTQFDMEAVDRTIFACRTPAERNRLSSIADPYLRGHEVMAAANYYPTRFPERPGLVADPYPRQPRLDLPFLARDFDGVRFVDEPGAAGP